MTKFAILITTKNRLQDLKVTLQKTKNLISREDVECIVCDDGSSDGTSNFIENNYRSIRLIKNTKSKGLIYCRNRLMNLSKSEFAISLDDDLNFLTQNPLEIIESYFKKNYKCAVISFRIFWNLSPPNCFLTEETPLRMKSFAGGAHAFRMSAWDNIPNYPDWFVFYGEEDFVSYHLFKKKWEVFYVPDILVHHRVDIKNRRNEKDYQIRLRRSLRSGWYLYFLFYPFKLIPKKLIYTILMQLKLKVFKGDIKALLAILGAVFDVFINIPKIINNRNALNTMEYQEYNMLPDTVLYWTNEKKK